MQRDMDLCRLILFKIEKEYKSTALFNLSIDGYDMDLVAYHCGLLADAGLVTSYEPVYASDHIYSFGVGALTWKGHEFLDMIREDTVWYKTKKNIKEHMLPFTLDVVKTVASDIITKILKDLIG